MLYRLLLLVLTPVIFVHLVWRALKCGEWRYFQQRLGFAYDETTTGSVWIHCASVGEVRSVLPLLEELHQADPALRFLITSNTATSRRILLQYAAPWIDHLYCPIDWRGSVARFLTHTRPRCCYLFETEIWPNLLQLTHQAGAPIRIINGRISDSSMRKAGFLKTIYGPVFKHISSIHTRNDIDQQRFIELGSDASTTTTAGDLKLAQSSNRQPDKQQLTDRRYLLVVSTHADEELQIARQCKALMTSHLVVIAPRHPERSGSVLRQLQADGFNVVVHSSQQAITDDTDIYLIDAIGLLDSWFPTAACVIMGGTFVDRGGHNLMEPLAFGRALIYGPSIENFVEMNEIVQQQDAALQVSDYEQLGNSLRRWQQDNNEIRSYQQRAEQLTASLRSTLDSYRELMLQQLQAAV